MSKLTPGERAVNWAKALGVLSAALLSVLGYQNRDVVTDWLPGKGQVDNLVHAEIDDLIVENELRRAAIEDLRAALKKNNGPLWVEIKKLNAKIDRWHGE